MTPLQQARIVTLDDVAVEVLVETTSVAAPPPAVIQSKEDELTFKTQTKVRFEKERINGSVYTLFTNGGICLPE